MKELYDTLKEYDLKPKSYQKLGKAILVGTNNGHKYVVKEKVRDNNTNIYKYLESRSFNYYPKILSNFSFLFVCSSQSFSFGIFSIFFHVS